MFKTKNDICLTGRNVNSTGTDFDVADSEYADDTAVLYESRNDLVIYTTIATSLQPFRDGSSCR